MAMGMPMLQIADRVPADESQRMVGADAQCRDVGDALEVVAVEGRVEQRLVEQGRLQHAVGGGEQDDGGPAAPAPAGGFADEQRPAAVHRRQERHGHDRGDRDVAEQVLRDQGARKNSPTAGATRRGVVTRVGPVPRR
jgi:hypothetical protein